MFNQLETKLSSNHQNNIALEYRHYYKRLQTNVPERLLNLRDWMLWKRVERGGKSTKPPIDYRTGRLASVNDPGSRTGWKKAFIGMVKHKTEGLSLVISEPQLIGIDMDHVLRNGQIKIKAKKVLDLLPGCYTEVSPGGDGLRLFCAGTPTRTGKNAGKEKWLEIYNRNSPRHLTITGNIFREAKDGKLWYRHKGLDAINALFMQNRDSLEGNTQTRYPAHSPDLLKTDGEVIMKASNAKNKDKFLALWSGDCGGLGRSEADFALAGILNFWSGNLEQVDRLFRQSGLFRPKWDIVHSSDGQTYGEMTICRSQRRI